MAKLRLLARILGVRFDDLRQREQERKVRRLITLGAGMAALMVVLTVLAVVAFRQSRYAEQRRVEAEGQRVLAEQRRREAEANMRIAELAKAKAEHNAADAKIAQADALLLAGRVP
jgi:Tfp pilus assembly protein PilX